MKRSSLWLVFLFFALAVAAFVVTVAFTLFEVHLHEFSFSEDAWFWYGIAITTLLTLVTWALAEGERSRRIRAAAERDRREKARIRKLSLEVYASAHHDAVRAELARKKLTVAQMLEQAKMEEPTYQLPPQIVHTRTSEDGKRLVPDLRARLLATWLRDTGEFSWPRTSGEAR